jgi:feruloyl esterase
MITRLTVIAALILFVVSPTANSADTAAPFACTALQNADFSSIQDAPTQVLTAHVINSNSNVPKHCQVEGYIAPQIGFDLKLPDSWNGKFIEVGCGGYCGTTKGDYSEAWCTDALKRGYACIQTDQGHRGNTHSALWAYHNLQGKFDFGIRAAHVAALAGKSIVHTYYGTAPKVSYFEGCSGGGRQALVEVQRFPWDFAGVIACEPSNPRGTGLSMLWNALATTRPDGKPLLADRDIELLHSAVLAACDAQDGVRDGVIDDPRACRFDPGVLTCKAGQTSDCLSVQQVEAVRKVYGGPKTSQGKALFYGAMPGSERGGFFRQDLAYKVDWYRYMALLPEPGPNWQATQFNWDEDYKRLGTMDSILLAWDNPDLRQFKTAGGKLIIVQGWDDFGSPLPLNTIDYYETVERVIGGRTKTQEFARLFMIPGRGHCRGGPGAGAIDILAHLESWVELGKAPDMIIGAHVSSQDDADFVRVPDALGPGGFTRPHYPYPTRAKYKGSGDPNDYRNFVPDELPLPKKIGSLGLFLLAGSASLVPRDRRRRPR